MKFRIDSSVLRVSRNSICIAFFGCFLIACESDGVLDIDTPEMMGEEIVDSLSCQGTRMWGPIPLQEQATYVSEANGQSAGGCGKIWTFDASRNCSVISSVSSEATTEVLTSGELTFQDPGLDSIRYELLPANISLDTLEGLAACPADTTTTEFDASSPLSCEGARVWGPSVAGEESYYISEAAGRSDLRDCAVFWTHNTVQNCVTARNIADDATARVTADGSLDFRFPRSIGVGENVFELVVAEISFLELSFLPPCS